MNQGELAEFLGITYQAMSEIMRELATAGRIAIVRTEKYQIRTYQIEDPAHFETTWL